MARAASHTAAVARSVVAIMWAHLCLTAWNWPMGRPNCSRILAYSDAVSVAHRATPTASADSRVDISARASARLRLDSTRSSLSFDGVGPHMGDGPQRVDTLDRFDLEVGGVEDHPQLARLDGDRQHQHRCLRGGWDGPHLTADHQRVA